MSHEPEDARDAARFVEVPLDALSQDALGALIEAFVGREGTDYGFRERSLEEKVADVRRQLERGEAQIVFDPETESVNIVPVRGSGPVAPRKADTRTAISPRPGRR